MARLCCCVARSLTTESCSRRSRDGRLAHQRLKSRTSICRLRAWPVAAVQPRVRLSSVADRRSSARFGSVRWWLGSARSFVNVDQPSPRRSGVSTTRHLSARPRPLPTTSNIDRTGRRSLVGNVRQPALTSNVGRVPPPTTALPRTSPNLT